MLGLQPDVTGARVVLTRFRLAQPGWNSKVLAPGVFGLPMFRLAATLDFRYKKTIGVGDGGERSYRIMMRSNAFRDCATKRARQEISGNVLVAVIT